MQILNKTIKVCHEEYLQHETHSVGTSAATNKYITDDPSVAKGVTGSGYKFTPIDLRQEQHLLFIIYKGVKWEPC